LALACELLCLFGDNLFDVPGRELALIPAPDLLQELLELGRTLPFGAHHTFGVDLVHPVAQHEVVRQQLGVGHTLERRIHLTGVSDVLETYLTPIL